MDSMFGSIIIRSAYGATDPTYNQGLIDDGETLIEGFTELAIPGRLLVNLIPALRHVPDWFPGTGWKKVLATLGVRSRRIVTQPFDDVKARVVSQTRSRVRSFRRKTADVGHSSQAQGTHVEQYPSVVGSYLANEQDESGDRHHFDEKVIRNAAALAYIGTSTLGLLS